MLDVFDLTRSRMMKVIRLPEHLMLVPITNESFEYCWNRIALALHLGDPVSKVRERPGRMSVLDSKGNRTFATYRESNVGDSGTQIKFVSPDTLTAKNTSGEAPPQKFSELVAQTSYEFFSVPNLFIDG